MDVGLGVTGAILQTCGIKCGIRNGRAERWKRTVSFMASWCLCATSGLPIYGLLLYKPTPICVSHWCTVFCYVHQKGFPTEAQWYCKELRLIWAFRTRKRVRFNKTWLFYFGPVCAGIQVYTHPFLSTTNPSLSRLGHLSTAGTWQE